MDDIGLEQQVPGNAEIPGKKPESTHSDEDVRRNSEKYPQDDIEFEQQIPGIAVVQGEKMGIKHGDEDASSSEEQRESPALRVFDSHYP